MNSAAVARAQSILTELRKLLPDQAARIGALAEKLEAAGNRPGATEGPKMEG